MAHERTSIPSQRSRFKAYSVDEFDRAIQDAVARFPWTELEIETAVTSTEPLDLSALPEPSEPPRRLFVRDDFYAHNVRRRSVWILSEEHAPQSIGSRRALLETSPDVVEWRVKTKLKTYDFIGQCACLNFRGKIATETPTKPVSTPVVLTRIKHVQVTDFEKFQLHESIVFDPRTLSQTWIETEVEWSPDHFDDNQICATLIEACLDLRIVPAI